MELDSPEAVELIAFDATDRVGRARLVTGEVIRFGNADATHSKDSLALLREYATSAENELVRREAADFLADK